MTRRTTILYGLAVLGTFGYFNALYFIHDPRFTDSVITADEMHWAEMVLLAVGVISGVICVVTATFQAFRHGRKLWGLLALFIWPSAFVYLWKYPRSSS